MSREERGAAPSFLSAARLSGLLLRVPCERQRVESVLARLGRFRLVAAPDCPVDRHPVHCELWSVSGGTVFFGGVDRHRWAQWVGAACGLSLGTLWSSTMAPWGMDWGKRGLIGRVVESNALMMSRATASLVGTYCELMVSVPGVVVEGDDRSRQHALVLGMLTDSALARWADLAFGFGYGKRPARFRRGPRGGWNVSSDGGLPLVSVSRHTSTARLQGLDLDEIEAVLQLPLLGSPHSGVLARSWLRRSSRQPDAHLAPVALSVETSKALLGGVLPERLKVPPYSRGHSGAIEFSNLEAWVSYPTRA